MSKIGGGHYVPPNVHPNLLAEGALRAERMVVAGPERGARDEGKVGA